MRPTNLITPERVQIKKNWAFAFHNQVSKRHESDCSGGWNSPITQRLKAAWSFSTSVIINIIISLLYILYLNGDWTVRIRPGNSTCLGDRLSALCKQCFKNWITLKLIIVLSSAVGNIWVWWAPSSLRVNWNVNTPPKN